MTLLAYTTCPDCHERVLVDCPHLCASPSPTPAAPAGSGWLTMTEDEYEEHIAGPMSGRTKYAGREPLRDERLLAEARAQRRRAEAAERERDERLLAEARAQRRRAEAAERERDEARSALTASREREAKLVALCEVMFSAIEDGSSVAINPESGLIDDAVTVFRARLAALTKGGET